MKVEMYMDLFTDDIETNLKMLNKKDHFMMSCSNQIWGASPNTGVSRIKIIADIPDKFFKTTIDEVCTAKSEIVEERNINGDII